MVFLNILGVLSVTFFWRKTQKPPKVVISEKTEVTGLGGFSVFKAVEENSLAKQSAKTPAIKGFRARGVKRKSRSLSIKSHVIMWLPAQDLIQFH